ncbi:LapA family protein [Fortiea sp. LEGE XX443]|uniref:LapA family protein n=1 Tax=Fortiea sp. LEGE XX443 TaxID=1828611 RepID=UPI001882D142|nr:LapA family protein [Fortiea sp. LEGE XX443]MBE9006353.1 LapA family protein [Fortiea sp. LEGE XX443]
MAVIRLILLVVVLGGLTLLLVQNWSPAISLAFLGMRTQQLPLAMWILFASTAGAFTSVLITTLFKFSSYFEGQPRQTPLKSAATSRRVKTPPSEEPTPPPFTSQSPNSQTKAAASEKFDDWETSNTNDDWDFEEQPQQTPPPNPRTQSARNFESEERQAEPKSSSQSGSVYSYSYREPKNTAVGKTESVYDADYRVIIPPYKSPADEPADKTDDDWSFFEDDEFGDDDKPQK